MQFKVMIFLPERLVNLKINEIYSEMKQFLMDRNYPIIVDEPSVYLSIKQGSIWGILPRIKHIALSQKVENALPCFLKYLITFI